MHYATGFCVSFSNAFTIISTIILKRDTRTCSNEPRAIDPKCLKYDILSPSQTLEDPSFSLFELK